MQQVEVQYLRPEQIIASRDKHSLVYLPVGPLEWHGPHLPLGIDPLRAQIAAVELARDVGGVVLPTLFVGTERERDPEMLKSLGFGEDDYVIGMDFPGNSLKSLYFNEGVFAVLIRNYLEMLINDWKFTNIVIVNGHGGANHVETLLRLQREFNETTDAKIIFVFMALDYPDCRYGGHASVEETATLMPYYPDTVDLTALPPKGEKLLNTKWGIIDDPTFHNQPTPDFTVRDNDDPRTADPEKGKEIFAETIEQMKEMILKEMRRPG